MRQGRLESWLYNLVHGESLSLKLKRLELALADVSAEKKSRTYPYPTLPGRQDSFCFSEKRVKFPKAGQLSDCLQKRKALHFFANHELLAIEMMAAFLLRFCWESEVSSSLKLHTVQTIQDEQKHFKLYLDRIEQLGGTFGEFAVNDFFWRAMPKLDSVDSFVSTMSLTFENANLDFASYYAHVFKEVGDDKTSEILKTVYKDELSHVHRGATALSSKISDEKLWDYYRSLLPFPVTPARARGINYSAEHRKKAGLPVSFIQQLTTYKDDYAITKRRK